MKNLTRILFRQLKVAALVIIVLNCSKKDGTEPQRTGALKLSVGISVTENSIDSRLKAGTGTDDFKVQIYNSSNELIKNFTRALDIPESVELPEGTYYAVASSDNNQPAAFNNPFYQGNSGSFTISKGQTTAATISCKLANIKVTVLFSANVSGSFSDYSAKVSNSKADLVFGKTESRAGYFDAGPLQIEATLIYTLGGATKTKTLNGSIPNAQVGKHYEVRIDASQSGGSSNIKIVLDETVPTEVVNISEGTPPPAGIQAGDILITEIMYHPSALGDPTGEWIEVYNNSSKTINLKDLVLRRASVSSFHQIASDVNMAPGTFAVLARTSTSTANVNYVYGTSISLVNSGNEIILNTYGTNGLDGTKICSVSYRESGFPSDQTGKSIQLDPAVKDMNAAMLGSNWCVSASTYSVGDYGSPGLINPACQ